MKTIVPSSPCLVAGCRSCWLARRAHDPANARVGNELLILGGVAVSVGGWFLAHRHGELRGKTVVTK